MHDEQQREQQPEQLDPLSQAWDDADESRQDKSLNTLDAIIEERSQQQQPEPDQQPPPG